MTPKEKAEDLISKMCLNDFTNENINYVKQYAIIAVDEFLSLPYLLKSTKNFYTQVKKEIEKL